MSQEEAIQQELISKFGFLQGAIRIPRSRRIFVDVNLENFLSVFDYIVHQLHCCHLCTITGLDEGEKLGFMYHVAQDAGIVITIKTTAPKSDPTIKTITNYFPGADAYEREIMDLFGAKVDGLAPGNRYPLTDDWPKDQFPLRKDWKPSSCQVTMEGHNHA